MKRGQTVHAQTIDGFTQFEVNILLLAIERLSDHVRVSSITTGGIRGKLLALHNKFPKGDE